MLQTITLAVRFFVGFLCISLLQISFALIFSCFALEIVLRTLLSLGKVHTCCSLMCSQLMKMCIVYVKSPVEIP